MLSGTNKLNTESVVKCWILLNQCMNMLDLEWNTTIHLVMILAVLGVRQGESLSPFLFSMYLNDIEEHFILNGFEGIDLDMFKLFLLLYADDIVIMSETEEWLKHGLFLLVN